MCIYSCIYSYVCIHLPIWCDSDDISRGSWHTELPLVDFWGFLWHHDLALRHMEPQPLLSYASKVPCWKSTLGSPQKAQNLCLEHLCFYRTCLIFAGKVVFRTLPCLICQGVHFEDVMSLLLLIGMGHFLQLEGLGRRTSKNNMKRSSLECVQTASPRIRRQWILFSGNSLGVANLGDSGGRLRFTQADWGLNTWILEPFKIQNINIYHNIIW